MERWKEGFNQKGKLYQQDVFSWCIQGRLKLLHVMLVLKSRNTCTNQIASSIVLECLSQSCCTGVLYSANLCFFDELQPIIAQSILFSLHLDRKKKKTDNYQIKR